MISKRVDHPAPDLASGHRIRFAKLDAWAKREGASEKLRKFKQELATRKRSK